MPDLDLPFVRSRRAPKLVPKTKPDLAKENERLRVQLAAMQVERDFWVEQARALQNHLQTVLRGQAAILEQMANSAVASADVLPLVQRMAGELRQPLTNVEAVMALTATVREGTQGAYTPRLPERAP